MDKSKKINFNFDDGGSLDKLRQNYEKFADELIKKSKNFGENSSGNSQSKYIKDEVEYYKQLFDIQQKTFNQKKNQHDNLQQRRSGLDASFKSGNISSGFYESNIGDIDSKIKEILKGTGRRSWATYEKNTVGGLDKSAQNVNRLEKLMENSNTILRDILGQDRADALKTIKAIEEDGESTPESRLAASRAKDSLGNGERKQGLVSKLLQADNLISLIRTASEVVTSSSALDAAKKTVQALRESAIGAADNSSIPTAGAVIRGAMLLSNPITDNAFEQYEKTNALNAQIFGNRALSGTTIIPQNMENSGYDFLEYARASNNIMRASGSSRNVNSNTSDAINLEKGYGINQNISQTLLELTRTNSDTDKNLINIVGGIYSSGKQIFNGDRTFLGEFITKNFVGLQKEFMKNQASVKSGEVMNVLLGFNKVGGQWDAKNPNSMGLISSVNNALTNPKGDTMDALSFSALRNAMPGAGILDTLIEREKGLYSSKYRKGMFDELDKMGGTKDMQVMNQADAFGISYTASKKLFEARQITPDLFSNMSQEEIKGYVGDLGKMAEENTTIQERQDAKTINSTIGGEKFSEIMKGMIEIFKGALEGATYSLTPQTRELQVRLGAARTPPVRQQ